MTRLLRFLRSLFRKPIEEEEYPVLIVDPYLEELR